MRNLIQPPQTTPSKVTPLSRPVSVIAPRRARIATRKTPRHDTQNLIIRMSMALIACALILALMAMPSLAQDKDDDGEGFLTRLIQDSLSGTGRDVDITGFRGALSSRATLDRMTIADSEGIWLELNDAVLDWNRRALLSGRLEVNELTAGAITLFRLPKGEPNPPKPEATGFAIPDLPVSVTIGRINAATVTLGKDVIGEPVTLGLDGRIALAGGGIDVEMAIIRTNKAGTFTLQADYAPDAATLAVNLTLREPADGIAARLLDLPGRPSVDLTIAGTGPLDDYRADIDLDTDARDRLSGAITLRADDAGGRVFDADLGGDVTALILPQYHDFFGPAVSLKALGTRGGDGAISLKTFDLTAAAIALSGSADISAAGQPVRFDVTGRIASADGSRVALPLGTGLSVSDTTLDVVFDAAKGDAVTGQFAIAALKLPGYAVNAVKLTLDGAIAIGASPSFGGDVTFDAAGVMPDDPAMARAIGDAITGGARIDWRADAPISIRALRLDGASYEASLNADITPADGTLTIAADGRAAARDLSAFAALTGTDLRGAADLNVDVTADLIGGTFDVKANGATSGLALGNDQIDPLLSPPATLTLDIARTIDGLTLRDVRLENDAFRATASGMLANDSGGIDYTARLENAGIFTGTQSGPVTLTGNVTPKEDGLRIVGRGAGTDLTLGIAPADLVLENGVQFSYDLSAGKQLILHAAKIETDQARISAQGDLTAGARSLSLDALLRNSALFTGGQAGAVSLDAQIREIATGWRVEATGGGDNIGIGNPGVDPLFAGRTDLKVILTAGERITLESLTLTNPQTDLSAKGDLTAGSRTIEARLRLANSAIFTGGQAGPVDLTASAQQVGGETYALTLDGVGNGLGIGNPAIDNLLTGRSDITVKATLNGQTLALTQADFSGTAINASANGSLSAEAIDLTLNARLDNVGRLTRGLSGPLSVTGDIGRAGDTTRVDLRASGPGGTTANVSGRVALPGGAVDLNITGQAPLALANAFIAPQSVAGTASFDMAVNGQPSLSALSGRVSVKNTRVVLPEVQLIAESFNGDVTLSGGQALVKMAGKMGGGTITVNGPVALNAPNAADLKIAVSRVRIERSGLVSTVLNGAVAITGPITGSGVLSGVIGLFDTEMRIPSGGFGGVEAIPDITHLNEPSGARATRVRAGLIDTGNGGGSGQGAAALGLDLLIRTDNSIFIRGRGLDAELRGQLRVEGTTADVRPVGQFDLVRGRLNILTKRLDLTEGRLSMAGDFEPTIRLVAQNQGKDYLVTITVEGPASAPVVTFASQPDLPQDEVLSQLFFERDLSSLSILQAAKLAAAVAELTGSGDGGLASKIRGKVGLDDLDITQTEDGQTSLRAGKYISENVYTEAEVTSKGDTNLSINLDISDNLTARGKITSGGNTSLGLVFQKDY